MTRKLQKIVFALLFLLVLLGAALVGLALLTRTELPERLPQTAAAALGNTANTALGRAVVREMAGQTGGPRTSGIFPLYDGRDAFAARTVLADKAEKSIDAQYYIWNDDMAGRLLLQSLLKAANRGVRVRLLLDDNNTQGLDALLVALDQHPHMEVRLFNPFMQRKQRALGFLSDFSRLNRRMHNKSFTVDGQITVVGGRNVGDAYYEVGKGTFFADLDVAAIGPVVQSVARQFETYWTSASVYPLQRIMPTFSVPATLSTLPATDALTQSYLQAVAASGLMQQLQTGSLPLYWAEATLIADDPAKGLAQAPAGSHVLDQLLPYMTAAQRELTIVSPYFVPTQQGNALLSDLARKPVAVSVLTNSLSATDVPAVHAGYARYRNTLLRAGVKIHELKRGASVANPAPTGAGQSDASLHAKVFSVDRQRIFVGSFNMDPRSAALNTEMGLMLESPELAQLLADGLAQRNPVFSYELALDNGQLQWLSHENGETFSWNHDPQTSWSTRALTRILALLPIEWLL